MKARTFFVKKVQPKNFHLGRIAFVPIPHYPNLLFFLRRFFFSHEKKKRHTKMSLFQQLSLQNARLVALCGAGGKTSLLYALGREWRAQGEKTALTTSTHIWASLPDGCALWDRPDEEKLLALWRAGFTPVAGRPLPNGKLEGPTDEMWALLRTHADRIIAEADGAARHPTKYPAAWEPAIPPHTDKVVVLAGLTALGRPLREVCHRADLAVEQGVLPDGLLNEAGLAALLLRGYGSYDPLYVLNQADDGALFARGETVAALLAAEGHKSVILSLKNLGSAQ